MPLLQADLQGLDSPKFDPREEKLQQQHQDTPLHLKL
jgi:hypothetical protein